MVTLAGIYLQAFGGGVAPIVMMVAIFAIFYFLLIMPQQRKQKKWQEMLKQVKPGDKVITSGGLKGRPVGQRRRGRSAGSAGQH